MSNETKPKTPEEIAAEAAASQETLRETIDAAEKAAETVTETPKAADAEPEKKDPADVVAAWYKPTWKKSAYVAGGLAVLGAVAFGLMKFLGDSDEETSESDGE